MIPADQIETTGPVSRAAPGEYGHFTTLQVRHGAVRGLQLHLDRLAVATRELLGCELAAGTVLKAMAVALSRSGMDDATVRVTVSPASASTSHASRPASEESGPRIHVAVSAPLLHPDVPLRLTTVVHERTLPHIKHVGTFASHHYCKLAQHNGFDDALFLDGHGRVLEGTFWNIGFWRGDAVVWPDAAALRGTGERLLREGLAAAGVRQAGEVVHVDALTGFDEAFIVNARGVRAVRAVDDVAWGLAEGAGVARLQQILAAVPWDSLAD